MKVFFICLYLLSVWMLPVVAKASASHIQLQLKWKHQFQFAGYYMALENGYYRDEGLDVDILEGGAGQDVLDFLKQGKHRYAVGGSGSMLVYTGESLKEDGDWLEIDDWQLLGGMLFVLLLLAGLALLYARKVLRDKTANLKESEAMWRHLVDIADVGIFIHRHGKMLFANNYMLERMELTADTVVGVEVAPYIHPDDVLLVSERVKRVMQDNAVIRSEAVRYIVPSGRGFDVEISSLRIMFKGEFAVLGVARDVTEKKKNELALQASEAQYRQLVERSPDAVLVHQDGVWRFSNPVGLAMMGATHMDELLGKSVMACVHPDYQKTVMERMKKELNDGDPVPLIEERLIRLDGSEFWAEVTGMPIQYEGAVASLLVVRDVTAKKLAEMKLRQEQQKMQIILDNAPIGIWMIDMNSSIQLINKGFCDLLGISEQALRAADVYRDALPDDVAVLCRASDQACMQRKQKLMVQEAIPCVDGKVHTFDMIKAPVFNDDGCMVGVVGLAIDATQRMEAEAEKDRMTRQIEHSQRLEALGVLAGGVAHDFNNILAVILGNASLIERKVSNDTDMALYLQRIVESSEKASLLCRQMLEYSGQGKIKIEPLNLTDLSQSIVSLLEVGLASGVSLSYDLDEALPTIDADEAQMQQILMNLVINASEAMNGEDGHIDLKTSVQQILPEDLQEVVGEPDLCLSDPYVCLQVTDNGCGMSDEVMQRIFEPFYTTKFTGRGLGMSALLGIVSAHHGCLCLHSQQGVGTRFRVFFPLGSLHVEKTAQVKPADDLAHRENRVVLLIDDEEIIRETVTAMLEDFGYDVMVAASGLEGIELYRQHQQNIAVVLLDVTMPQMNGLQCFQALKEINQHVKVFLTSGFHKDHVLEGVEDASLAGFIQKPYHPEALEAVLNSVMSV
ncbi:MAG: PAS domain S-box protein [Mariprofundaceae bacterium]|nr:PAS domain S-box protein [Mariprofundaceae bacterium]